MYSFKINFFKKFIYIFSLIMFSNIYHKTVSDSSTFFNPFFNAFNRLVLNYAIRLKDLRQIASQGQLDEYGTIIDIRELSNGNYAALFKSPVDNNGNSTLIFYILDKDFKQIWWIKIDDFKDTHLFYDFSIETNLFVYILPRKSGQDNSAIIIDLNNRKAIKKDLSDTTYIGALQTVKIANYGSKNYYLACIYNGGVMSYNLIDWSCQYNPTQFEVLLNYLSHQNAKIADCFVIDSSNSQDWVFRLVSNEDGCCQLEAHDLTMQPLVYTISNSTGYITQYFQLQDYKKYYGSNLRLCPNNLILLGNLFSHEAYLESGINQLDCSIYSLSLNHQAISFIVNSPYWSLGHSGDFFIKKDKGLFTTKKISV